MTTESEETVFTNLRSDIDLRSDAKQLEIENDADSRALEFILKQKQLSLAQRTWMKSLIARDGAQFDPYKVKKGQKQLALANG